MTQLSVCRHKDNGYVVEKSTVAQRKKKTGRSHRAADFFSAFQPRYRARVDNFCGLSEQPVSQMTFFQSICV